MLPSWAAIICITDPEFIQGSSSQPMEVDRPIMTNRANDLMARIDAMTIEEEQRLYEVDDDLYWDKGVDYDDFDEFRDDYEDASRF